MSGVTLKKSSITTYLPRSYRDTKNTYYKRADINIPVNSTELLDEYERHTSFQYTSSLDGTDDVWVSAELRNNTIEVVDWWQQKTVKWKSRSQLKEKHLYPDKAKVVELSSYGCLLEKGHTQKLRVKGCSGKNCLEIFWFQNCICKQKWCGKRKEDWKCIDFGKLGDQYVGCVVSVTTAQIKKVCAKASYMGKTGNTVRQSADKRDIMIAVRWCGKLISPIQKSILEVQLIREPQKRNLHGAEIMENCWKAGFSWKKLKQMKFNPGDIVFKSEDSSHPYATTYHVEMLTGYVCYRFDKNGEPWIEPALGDQRQWLWCGRGSAYGKTDKVI